MGFLDRAGEREGESVCELEEWETMELKSETGKMKEGWVSGQAETSSAKLEMPVRHSDARKHLLMR